MSRGEELSNESVLESPQDAGKPSRKFNWKWILPLAMIVLAVGVFFWLHGRNRETTDDAQVDGHIDPVSSKIVGSVLEVLVEDNDRVKQGQPLVRIDPRDYQLKVDQERAALAVAEARANAANVGVPLTRATTASGTSGAQAQLAAAQAEYERARVSSQRAETSGIAVAQANVAQAEAQQQNAQADLNRMRPLLAKQEISRQQFDAYQTAAQVAEARLTAAREEWNAAGQAAANARAAEQAALANVNAARAGVQESQANQQKVNVSSAEAKTAAAAVQQARADLAAAELQLSYATITAAEDGIVTQKTVEPGQTVASGQALMAVVPLHNVWVTANFKETQLAHMRPGNKAEIKVDAYGVKIEAEVQSIAGATGAVTSLLPPENATGNFVKVVQRIPVKIVFQRLPDGIVLRPGMNVEATVITK